MVPPRPLVLATLLLAGCHHGETNADAVARASGPAIDAHEAVHFTGTEPFWAGEVAGSTLTWRTAEKPGETAIPVTRFSGRNGAGYSGMLDGRSLNLAVSEVPCSDGMSDRRYPFAVTVLIGPTTLRGCGWSATHPPGKSPHP